MGRGRGWWPWLAILAAVAGVLLLGWWTFDPVFDRGTAGLGDAADRAQLTGLVLAAAVALVGTVRWARQRSGRLGAAAPAADTLAQAKELLAELVDQQWKQEARLRSLDDPDPIPVRWRTPEAAELMDHAINIDPSVGPPGGAGGPARLWWTASSADIGALADRFRRTRRRRLVILGGPGTGKTTLALQLLLHLLATRTADEPVPVLLPVAGWDTRRHPRLQDWIADRLASDYPALRSPELGAEVARALAGRGHILPVLDGLDELPPPAQKTVITALNRSLGGDDQLILTSRTTEFTAAVTMAGDVITSAAVLEPRPLTPAAAADHLTHCLPPNPGPAWRQALNTLRTTPLAGQTPPGTAASGPGAALAGVAATPLGLWLLRTVYTAPGADPAELTDPVRFPTPAALQAHLFDRLIDAVIATRDPSSNRADPFRPRRRHDPDKVRQWLGHLAHHLSGQGTRDFAWWRLAATTHAVTRTTAFTLALLTTLMGGLAGGLTLGLVFGFAKGLVSAFATGLTEGFMSGLVFGLVFGLMVGFSARSWQQDSPGYADLRIRQRSTELVRKLATGFAIMFASGFTRGFASGFVLGLADGPADGLASVLVVGLLIGLVFGLVFGLADGLAGGLAFGLGVGLASGAGNASGAHRAWLAYLVAAWRLDRAGLLPRRLMPFLDDCHRLGLLRAVGPIYQIRHAELHDHLAATHPPPHNTGRRHHPT